MTTTQRKRAPYRETKRLKPEQRKREILDGARLILVEKGYSGLTLRSVAERAGIRLATLQYYFRSSESLFQAAFQDIAESVWRDIMELTDARSVDSPQERMRSFLLGMHASTENRDLASCFSELWARARIDTFAAEIMEEYYRGAIKLLAQMIKDCQPATAIGECRRRATLILAMTEGLTVLNFAVNKRPRPPSISRRYAISTMLNLALQQ